MCFRYLPIREKNNEMDLVRILSYSLHRSQKHFKPKQYFFFNATNKKEWMSDQLKDSDVFSLQIKFVIENLHLAFWILKYCATDRASNRTSTIETNIMSNRSAAADDSATTTLPMYNFQHRHLNGKQSEASHYYKINIELCNRKTKKDNSSKLIYQKETLIRRYQLSTINN